MRRRDLFGAALLVVASASTGGSSQAAETIEEPQERPYDGVVVLSATDDGFAIEQIDLQGRSLERAIVEESGRPNVISVSPNSLVKAQVVPNDPLQPQQEHLGIGNGVAFGIDAPGAWSRTTGSSNVVVAVVDSGVRPHAEFSGRLLPGYDFVDFDSNADDPGDGGWRGCAYDPSSWHGTHVAGLIAAGANGFGTVGVAPGVKILPVRVLGPCGTGDVESMVAGVMWAAGVPLDGFPANPNPAQVINLSLGATDLCSPLEQFAIDSVTARGAMVVAAAGNEAAPAQFSTPANCRNTFTVGASLHNGGRASYSNYGTTVDVFAPGGGDPSSDGQDGLLSTVDYGYQDPEADAYMRMQGTSMAAPVVAGIAALIKSVKPSATPGEMAAALRASAMTCRGGTCPNGVVNARLALDAALKGVIERPIDSPSSDVTFPTRPSPDPAISQDRYGGQGAAEVAEATARYAATRRSMLGLGSFEHAVIASQTSFADALTASVYAGAVGGVILFTDPQRLSVATSRVIDDLGIKRVTFIGGPAAISSEIEDRFRRQGLDVQRLWGQNRYDTARAVSSKVLDDTEYLFIASGRNFADAVAVGPVVYAGGLPMVLAGQNGLDSATQDLIIQWQELNPRGRVVILGGTSAVPASVETQLATLNRPFRDEDGYFGGDFCIGYPSSWPSCPIDLVPVGIPSYRITRLGGADRFETAAKVAQWASSLFFDGSSSDVGFATGRTFTDALAAANILGQEAFGGPLLLTGTCMRMPRATYDAARGYQSQRIIGGGDGVCDFDADILRGKR